MFQEASVSRVTIINWSFSSERKVSTWGTSRWGRKHKGRGRLHKTEKVATRFRAILHQQIDGMVKTHQSISSKAQKKSRMTKIPVNMTCPFIVRLSLPYSRRVQTRWIGSNQTKKSWELSFRDVLFSILSFISNRKSQKFNKIIAQPRSNIPSNMSSQLNSSSSFTVATSLAQFFGSASDKHLSTALSEWSIHIVLQLPACFTKKHGVPAAVKVQRTECFAHPHNGLSISLSFHRTNLRGRKELKNWNGIQDLQELQNLDPNRWKIHFLNGFEVLAILTSAVRGKFRQDASASTQLRANFTSYH